MEIDACVLVDMVFQVSDGQANTGHEPFTEALALHARGDLTIVTIGVGNAANLAELQFMASCVTVCAAWCPRPRLPQISMA